MPTLTSNCESEHTSRPKVLTSLVKGSLMPPKFRNMWVVTILVWDSEHNLVEKCIKSKDEQIIQQAIQFGFNCEAAYTKKKEPKEGYSHVEGYSKFCVGDDPYFTWPEKDGVVADFAGFEVYFYDMNGTQTSVVINYKD